MSAKAIAQVIIGGATILGKAFVEAYKVAAASKLINYIIIFLFTFLFFRCCHSRCFSCQ
jgi:hypothetical protein